jgi:iron complex transport system ATP-binding protein
MSSTGDHRAGQERRAPVRPERGLVLSDIGVSLGGKTVLAGIDLCVEPGEVVGLVGPNGAGKSTLMRIASRVLAPDTGEARFAGRPLADYPRRELSRRISIVPQEIGIPFPFRAGELVVMGRAPHQPLHGFDSSEDMDRARDALDRVGILHLAERSVFELSGGERQLVAFARSLAQDADLLLLDEPTAFLDLRHRVEVLGIVRELAAEGRAALVVSHDLNLVARACDRLEVLAAGRQVARGAPAQVISEGLLAEAYGVDADVFEGPDGTPVVVPRLR